MPELLAISKPRVFDVFSSERPVALTARNGTFWDQMAQLKSNGVSEAHARILAANLRDSGARQGVTRSDRAPHGSCERLAYGLERCWNGHLRIAAARAAPSLVLRLKSPTVR